LCAKSFEAKVFACPSNDYIKQGYGGAYHPTYFVNICGNVFAPCTTNIVRNQARFYSLPKGDNCFPYENSVIDFGQLLSILDKTKIVHIDTIELYVIDVRRALQDTLMSRAYFNMCMIDSKEWAIVDARESNSTKAHYLVWHATDESLFRRLPFQFVFAQQVNRHSNKIY